MLKSLIVWHIKKWWPLLLIFTTVISIFFVSSIQAMGMTTTTDYYNSSVGYRAIFMLYLAIPAMLTTFVMPIFVYIYRTSLQAVDCFYQAGHDKKTISRVRVTIGLIIVLASMTIAFLLGYLLLTLRYFSTPEVESYISQYSGNTIYTYRVYYNFGYIFLTYLLLLLMVGGQYFINCFFVSLGDNIITQIFYLVLGSVVTTLFLAAPYSYSLVALDRINDLGIGTELMQYCFIGFGPIQSIMGVFLLMMNPITIGYYVWEVNYLPQLMIIVLVLHFVFSLLALLYTMYADSPSGEYAGKSTPRHWTISIFPHIAALLIAVLLSILGYFNGSGGVLLNIFSVGGYLFFVTIYYALLSLLRKSFKPRRFDLIAFISVAGTGLILMLVSTAIGV
ncbi:MAG: hypothetical protein K6B65_04935 [Bacilli bacterium]|nr:hypothetical protein [Bacilli bacterium]